MLTHIIHTYEHSFNFLHSIVDKSKPMFVKNKLQEKVNIPFLSFLSNFDRQASNTTTQISEKLCKHALWAFMLILIKRVPVFNLLNLQLFMLLHGVS